MHKIKGKCKSCLGCNLLEDFGFKGRKKCKNYIKDNTNWFEFITAVISLLVIATIIMFTIYRFSILCGG